MFGMSGVNTKHIDKALSTLLQVPDNAVCADCLLNESKWASTNIGVFLCIKCAGIHRNLGKDISSIQSVSLDRWEMSQVETMQRIGNRKANAFYLANFPGARPPKDDFDKVSFIQDKYKRLKWVKDGDKSVNIGQLASVTLDDTLKYSSQVKTLVEMGFNKVEAMAALKKSAGDLEQAIQVISQNTQAVDSKAAGAKKKDNPKMKVGMRNLYNMGFKNFKANRRALKKSNFNLEEAINLLITLQREMEAPSNDDDDLDEADLALERELLAQDNVHSPTHKEAKSPTQRPDLLQDFFQDQPVLQQPNFVQTQTLNFQGSNLFSAQTQPQQFNAPAQQLYNVPVPQQFNAPAQQLYNVPVPQQYSPQQPAQQLYNVPVPQQYSPQPVQQSTNVYPFGIAPEPQKQHSLPVGQGYSQNNGAPNQFIQNSQIQQNMQPVQQHAVFQHNFVQPTTPNQQPAFASLPLPQNFQPNNNNQFSQPIVQPISQQFSQPLTPQTYQKSPTPQPFQNNQLTPQQQQQLQESMRISEITSQTMKGIISSQPLKSQHDPFGQLLSSQNFQAQQTQSKTQSPASKPTLSQLQSENRMSGLNVFASAPAYSYGPGSGNVRHVTIR